MHELPADAVHTADGQAEKPQFIVEVTMPEGALSDRRRGEMVGEATELIVEAAGLPRRRAHGVGPDARDRRGQLGRRRAT